MADPLSPDALMAHVHALARGIGPRPAGHPAEALARKTSKRHPELDVRGRPMVILEEVGALRRRGYRDICLVGVSGDGWLPNWHRHADDVDVVEAVGLARAARFALAMMQTPVERSP